MSTKTLEKEAQTNRTKLLSQPSRVWFMGHGFRQVPPEMIEGKVLWAHPDGYFVNRYGKRVMHNFSPSQSVPGNHCHNGKRGNLYPIMRHFGNKTCHLLMCVTFHGPRPLGYECDHLNGNVLDYSSANLEWVTRKENIRRSVILRGLRKNGIDPSSLSYSRLRSLFAQPLELIPGQEQINREMERHCEL